MSIQFNIIAVFLPVAMAMAMAMTMSIMVVDGFQPIKVLQTANNLNTKQPSNPLSPSPSSLCYLKPHYFQYGQPPYKTRFILYASSSTSSSSSSSPPPLPNTEDPYLILGLLTPTVDKKVIKRAYRRLALQYHPDVRINTNSSAEEKQRANDEFARINAAYAILTGKDSSSSSSSSSRNGSSSSSSSSSRNGSTGGYTPPHRRSSSSRSQSTKTSPTWEDFMPKYEDDEQYDTNGDSFGAIFSDFLSGSGSSSGSGGTSILNDLISFLEGNFPSVGTTKTKEEDVLLESLLQIGNLQELKMEFDDAKLLVKQLEGKLKGLQMEMDDVESGNVGSASSASTRTASSSSSYMEQMRMEEKRKELEARREIVQDYLDRAKVRQIKLRKRIEEVKSQEFDSSSYSSSSTSSQGSTYSTSSSSSYNNSPRSNGTSPDQKSTRTNTSSAGDNASSKQQPDDNWKREGFGSSGRRRGRGRSSSSSRSSPSSESTSNGRPSSGYTASTSSSSNAEQRSSSKRQRQSSPTPSSQSRQNHGYSSSSSRTSSSAELPPHRRLTSRMQQQFEDKRRLREIKVDEEIEQMKKDLGI